MTSQIYGLPSGVLYGQNERVDELNGRMQSRQFPDQPLAPNFDSRPVLSRNSTRFSIIDRKTLTEAETTIGNFHDVRTNFNPATRIGPPSTFLANVDIESGLRNQTVALQKGAIQGVYVPSSDSDLYKINVTSRQGEPFPHPGLFETSHFDSSFREISIQNSVLGKQAFHNNTRTQLRDM